MRHLPLAGALALAAFALACDTGENVPPTASGSPSLATSSLNGSIGIEVVLKGPATADQLNQLSQYGKILDQLPELNALHMRGKGTDLPAIQALPFVAAAGPDAARDVGPISPLAVTNFANGINTWDLDAVNVTSFGDGRAVAQNGTGVYVIVLDTGLLPQWQFYFPTARIATQYAKSFGGGGQDQGNVSEQPNKWEQDVQGHGTHVTSTIIGYNLAGTSVNGVAPLATIVPVKVLNQNGSGWSSVIARGIVYATQLKMGPLTGHPVVVNMSLGGPALDPVEQAAVDYAVAHGVIIVAAAGNAGNAGMHYPGAYGPVISAASAGFIGEWTSCLGGSIGSWWVRCDVPDPSSANDLYISDFSSRAKAGQDLDVAAPGSWVVGPFQTNNGQINYFFLGGTSMATPHVAGIVALMTQKNGSLTAPQVEGILEAAAIPMPPGSKAIHNPDGSTSTISWGADATGAGFITADAAIAGTP